MIVYPNCKINIGLNVVGRRQDGYHDIETVFCPIELMDALEVREPDSNAALTDNGYQLKVSGAVLDGRPDDNLVVRAYRLLKTDFPSKIKPISIHLFKHVPTGAGLGGGSADAAYMLKLLNQRFSLNLTEEELEQYASRLGADCAFFVKNRPVFAQGIGDVMSEIDLSQIDGMSVLLVKPEISISTAEAYRGINPQKPKQDLRHLLSNPVETWRDSVVNDFETTVFLRNPEIAAIKDRIYDLGAVYAQMTGSGAAVYGLFRDALPANIEEAFEGCFCRQRVLACATHKKSL